MALRLLMGGMLLAALVTACIWPSEYTVVQPTTNQPPVIDTTAALAEVAGTVLIEVDGRLLWDPGADENDIEFQLRAIEDADIDDTLYAVWYVARDPNDEFLKRPTGNVDVIPPSGTAIRSSVAFPLSLGVARRIDLLRNQATDGGAAATLRPYPVEVVVGDRAPDLNGEFSNEARLSRWRWLVIRSSTGGQ